MITTRRTRSTDAAAEYIRRGEVVAFPTETVYGLGADGLDATAVAKIFEAKKRPADNPLILHVSSVAALDDVASDVPPIARTLVDAFWPGPLTVVVRKHSSVPAIVTAGLDTVGVRMPALDVALAFLDACATPVAAPSANRSGRPSPTTADAVLEDLDGRISCVLLGERSEIGLESTVVDCSRGGAVVLRAGGVSVESLRAVVADIRIGGALEDGEAARSPGAKYRHYAPRARVVLVDWPPEAPGVIPAAFVGLAAPAHAEAWANITVVPTVEAYASALFDAFRRFDAADVAAIYCQRVEPVGLGLALADRLERAARS